MAYTDDENSLKYPNVYPLLLVQLNRHNSSLPFLVSILCFQFYFTHECFALHVSMFIMCAWRLWRPEEGLASWN